MSPSVFIFGQLGNGYQIGNAIPRRSFNGRLAVQKVKYLHVIKLPGTR